MTIVKTQVIQFIRRAQKKIEKTVRTRSVEISQILRGGELGLSAAQYARHTGDLLRPSTPFIEGPHVAFLQQYQDIGTEILEPSILRKTAYFQNGIECIDRLGRYFAINSEEGLVELASNFIKSYHGHSFRGNGKHSGSDKLPVLTPICRSSCFELVDGNHKLAIDYIKGKTHCKAVVGAQLAVTPVQQLLLDVGWNPNKPEVYQPVDCPEVGDHWKRVRNCEDRLQMMIEFLKTSEHDSAGSYLDVACNYGWFVAQMSQAGYDAHGMEIDYAAREIGKLIYGLPDEKLTRGQVIPLLENVTSPFEIVSCFSLLHHFVMGRANASAEELISLLDRATGRILFFETGQNHEAWFRETLGQWDVPFIEKWLRDNTTFKNITNLGIDRDNVPPFQKNYGRTLFACTR